MSKILDIEVNIIKEDYNSELIITTPLLPKHKISRDTKVSIKRNDIPFTWITCSGENNIPTNWWYGSKQYKYTTGNIPPYILPLDRDIKLGRHMLDRMLEIIKQSDEQYAFCYCNFEFKGSINNQFPCQPYDINRLLQGNYISSNSMMKYDYLEFIGGPVMDDMYKRLLDWALWLKFYQYGYYGIPCPTAHFVAFADEDSISARSSQDYRKKHQRVHRDFVIPIAQQAQAEVDQAADLAGASVEEQDEVISMFD